MTTPTLPADAGTRHPDRPVRLERTAHGPVIVKRYVGKDGARIHDEAVRLWRSPFGEARTPPGIPRPLEWRRPEGEAVMEAIAGDPVGARADLGRTLQMTAPCARLLADLHGSGAVVGRIRDAKAVVRSVHAKLADFPEGPQADLAAEVVNRLAVHAAQASADDLVPGHGDFSPRNVLATPDGPRLIDLDRLAMCDPGRDVAYWGSWIWATTLLAGDVPDWGAAADFEHAYVRLRPASAARIGWWRGFNRAAALLRMAHGWSALRDRPELQVLMLCEALAQVHEG